MREIITALAAGLLGAASAVLAAGPPGPAAGVEPLPLTARALPFDEEDADARPAAPMRFLGAVRLDSSLARFGGLSGLAFAPGCGRLLSVSDTGNWVVIAPVLRGDLLVGARGEAIAPVLDPTGAWTPVKEANDAEGLAMDGARVAVSYEQAHRVRRFAGVDACRPETLGTAATDETPIPDSAGWRPNGGAEALAWLPDGRLLAIREDAETGTNAHAARIWTPGGPARALRWVAPRGFSVTDAAVAEGRLFVLHRRFGAEGVAAAVVVAPLAVLAGAEARGVEVLRLQPPRTVDNMEGLAVEARDGRTFVWLASDDNFQPWQRTLLMRFELVGR